MSRRRPLNLQPGCFVSRGGQKPAGFPRFHGRRARHHQFRQAPAPSRKRRIAPTRRWRKKPDWIRVKAPVSPGYAETQRDRARERPAYGLRGGRLPQYRRVLGEEARDLHDHGRHLHARLRLLQRQDRAAGAARCRASRSTSPRRPPSSASPMWSSPRSIATISTTAGPRISRDVIRAIRARCPTTTIEVLTPDFLRKDGAVEMVVAAQARRVQPQSRNRAVALSHGPAGRALLRTRSACCSG